MREDNQLLVITHLSQLVTLVTGFGSLLIPLILWVTQKEKVYKMNEQRKNKIIDNIRNVDSSQFVTKLTLEKILHNRNLFFND